MPPRLPESLRSQVVPAFRELKTAAAVADRLNIGRTTVLRILAEAGVDRGAPSDHQVHPHKLTPEREADVARRYAAGERSGALADEYGCSVFLVRKLARRAGCIIYGRGNRYRDFSDAEIAEMARMWRGGESQSAIARKIGSTQAVVSNMLRRHGFAKASRKPVGSRHGHWKGGRVAVAGGYVRAWVAPTDPMAAMANRSGYVLEHRLVMARKLGRALSPRETVHHINGVRSDNRPENLELWASRHPRGERVTAKHCPTCTCGEHA